MKHKPGIGLTPDLGLRVSVAMLLRVVFKHPGNNEWMLALERKATLHETGNGHIIEIKSQPFGGAIRILDLNAIYDMIGDFHFDSEHSRAEQDFRIFIRPSAWETVQGFCINYFRDLENSILEADPRRELAEEFEDALKISLKPEQYIYKPVGIVVDEDRAPTDNIHARGIPTVRVYRIFEARILDPSLSHAMLTNSESYSNQDLCDLALQNARNGGKGRSNAVLALPMKLISDAYLAMSPEARNLPVSLEDNHLDESVAAILEHITVPKYRRL